MADAVAENPIILDIMKSYGGLIIGDFFSCVLWGISCMQCFLYFINYDNDHWGLKSLVAFVWSVDTANLILMLKSIFPVLILQWGRVAGLSESQVELLHHNWVGGIVAVAVQMFFLYRIYVFSGNRWLFPVLMLPIVWWQVIGTIPYNVVVFRDNRLAVISEPRQIAFSMSLRAASCVVDVIIALVMSWLLVKNGRSSFRSSKKLVVRLIYLTINTGTWTAICALMVFITILVFPNDLIFCAFEFPLSGLYVNTLMANLNARRYLKGSKDKEWTSNNTPNPNANLPLSQLSRRGDLSGQENTVTIRVDTSQAVKGDDHFPLSSKHDAYQAY